jgi:hypothetical protein
MRLDTGCDGGLHWVNSKSSSLTGRSKTPNADEAPEMIGAELQIGHERWFEPETFRHSRGLFPGERGLIGNGILSKFLVTIDLSGQRLALEKIPQPIAGTSCRGTVVNDCQSGDVAFGRRSR